MFVAKPIWGQDLAMFAIAHDSLNPEDSVLLQLPLHNLSHCLLGTDLKLFNVNAFQQN